MSFSFDTTKQQASTTSAPNVQPAALPTFSFGPPIAVDSGKPLTPGFSLMSTPAQSKPGGLFGTGLTNTPPQNTGLSFGTPNTSAPPLAAMSTPQTAGLSFGTNVPANTGISFGGPNAAPSMGFPTSTPAGSMPSFGLGGSTVATTAPATAALSFGITKPAASTGFALGGGDASQPVTGSGLTFGTPNAIAPGSSFNLGGMPTATTASATTTTTATGFNLGTNLTSTTAAIDSAKTSTVQTGFNVAPSTAPLQSDPGFGTSIANTTATTGFSLIGTGTTSAATGFSFGTGTTAASTTGFSLNKTATAPTSLATASTQASLGTTTTVTSSANGTQQAPINFFQLEESINKWTLELEEQEKVFVNQATQVNAWDKLLISNGEKIVTLNQEVERVKIEQQQLEHELDYVVGQQKELQDCLVPLEKELASHSVSDPEREHTYGLAKDLDTQLKRMSEDLKEIIEHLNQANRSQDSSDPIVQIGKILNAHMNSLQWLDQQTALLSQKIQQIDQMHQNFRQENERSFNLAYN